MKKTNAYTIDHANNTITITREFAKRSAVIASEEYRVLSQLHKDFPEYTIQPRKANVDKNKKKTHVGLTLDFMKKYLERLNDPAALNEFESVKAYYKGHPAYYAKVKAWFLSKYEDYDEYNPAA